MKETIPAQTLESPPCIPVVSNRLLQSINMISNLASVRNLNVTAAVLGLLGVASILRAAENGSTGMEREMIKPSVSAESLEHCELVGLKRVYFQYDGSVLTAKEKSTLAVLAKEFSQETQAIIELRGYTDGKEAQSETALGTKRSEAIAHYLEEKGVPSSSILLVTTDSTDEQNGSANPEHRRVDVRVFAAFGTGGSTQSARLQSPKGE